VAADAEASSSGVAAAAAAGAVAAVHAGYGHHSAGSTAVAGVSPRLGQRYLMSRRSHPHRKQKLREKVAGISSPHEPNSVLRLQLGNSSGRVATLAAIRRASSFVRTWPPIRRAGLLLEIETSEQAPWRKVRKVGLEQRPSGSVRGHLAIHLNWILRMAQLLRDADKCADPIDILGAIAALGERECPI
jgi:hypothetical protein